MGRLFNLITLDLEKRFWLPKRERLTLRLPTEVKRAIACVTALEGRRSEPETTRFLIDKGLAAYCREGRLLEDDTLVFSETGFQIKAKHRDRS